MITSLYYKSKNDVTEIVSFWMLSYVFLFCQLLPMQKGSLGKKITKEVEGPLLEPIISFFESDGFF
jgi:hypothetical protein